MHGALAKCAFVGAAFVAAALDVSPDGILAACAVLAAWAKLEHRLTGLEEKIKALTK